MSDLRDSRNPYASMPQRAFWRPSISHRPMHEISDLWKPKHALDRQQKIATAGSCFAQHISKALLAHGFNWQEAEALPSRFQTLSPEQRRQYGYGVFSFRTGNIYTTSLLRQWIEAAFGVADLDDEVWESANGAIIDPLRPVIEPTGFASLEECVALRRHSLEAMRALLTRVDRFVFTLGLTEGWRNRQTGLVYPACPGTLGGAFDDKLHEFHNQSFVECLVDLTAVLDLLREQNANIRFLLTVSPVPLVATAEDDHVLVSTVHSKSVLRAVAGELAKSRSDTDYFPSYEIITGTPFCGAFFMENKREVSKAGVEFVMQNFFAGLGIEPESAGSTTPPEPTDLSPVAPDFDVQCEEALLEAFSK